jgi:hypothetical protein
MFTALGIGEAVLAVLIEGTVWLNQPLIYLFQEFCTPKFIKKPEILSFWPSTLNSRQNSPSTNTLALLELIHWKSRISFKLFLKLFRGELGWLRYRP